MINLHNFLQTYFLAFHCQVSHNNDGVLTIKLTEEMDKALMNRPFYWHYMKSLGHTGEPSDLTLVTDPDHSNEDGEWIHFGSPRLQQIFTHLKQTGGHIKLFQKINNSKKTPVYPWLVTNIKISYKGKQNRDELFSIGLNLINGMMTTNMMDLLEKIPLHMTISDYCYPISPLIKLNSGYMRVTAIIEDYLKRQSYEWANESLETLAAEKRMVRHFYMQEDDDEQLKKEINELTKLYKPKVSYKVVNGGLVYLSGDIT